MNQESKNDIEIKAATHLALVEIVLGSIGHGFRIPFAGTFLSFYQLYVLLWLILRKKVEMIQVFNISVIVALLKTLSPMGKKITPMIAISVQGLVLWLGSAIFGANLFGLFVGSTLFVSWSLIQQALGYFILYGVDFFKMIDFFQAEIQEYANFSVYLILFSWWILKIFLAVSILTFIYFRRDEQIDLFSDEKLKKWQSAIISSGIEKTPAKTSAWRRALIDLFNPFFFLTLILMVFFHFFRQTDSVYLIWFVCRTLAVGFLIFYLLRSDWLKRVLVYFFGKNRYFRTLYRKTKKINQRLFS